MHRRIPYSGKKKKEQLRAKRAKKRGDVEDPEASSTLHGAKMNHRRRIGERGHRAPVSGPSAATKASRRLQSSFVRLPRDFLDETRHLADNLPLPRPIPPEAAVWRDADHAPDVARGADAPSGGLLTCPRRPKWRYEMSKAEVEKNEEVLFRKWLEQTDSLVDSWNESKLEEARRAEEDHMPSAPTSFERNIEVWRQLWRVTEISQILLILLDSRCPLLHYPPSLAAFLSSPPLTRKRTVLVLTKSDIAGPARTAAWIRYFHATYPGVPVVAVESYVEKPLGAGAGKRKAHEPFIPSAFRQNLVDALRETHAELLEPPAQVKANPEKLKTWNPRVKRDINWDLVMTAHGGQTGTVVHHPSAHTSHDASQHTEDAHSKPREDEVEEDDTDPDFLTIGLIGQPNVGKSSLLNALFGTSRVSASKTPGKTKHFQTLFWTPEVRLVDCPGLVMPNFVPMETQVLAGTLPISRVSAVPLCVHHAATLLPLERIFGLAHPSTGTDPAAPPKVDKRTWRTPRPAPAVAASADATETSTGDATLTSDATSASPSSATSTADATPTSGTTSTSPSSAPPPTAAPAHSPTPAQPRARDQAQRQRWTALDVLTALATKKGWMTAKTGWPDVNRAGNAVLRSLAEGRVPWAFWPPGTPASVVTASVSAPASVDVDGANTGIGIWIPSPDEAAVRALHLDDLDDEAEDEAEDDEAHTDSDLDASGSEGVPTSEGEEDQDEDEDEEAEEEAAEISTTLKARPGAGGSRFAALSLVGDDEGEGVEDDDAELEP